MSSTTKKKATHNAEYSSAKKKLASLKKLEMSSASVDGLSEAASSIIEGGLSGSEIVIGLVDSVGTDHNSVIDQIRNCLRPYDYSIEIISVSSDIIPTVFSFLNPKRRSRSLKEHTRIESLMDGGDNARALFKNNGILAYGVASTINLLRQEKEDEAKDGWPGYAKKTAYVIKTLKRPEEVAFLRRIYGPGFYLLSIYTDKGRRKRRLIDRGVAQHKADDLIRRDADGYSKYYGQRGSDTYHLADFFIHLEDSSDHLKANVKRICRLIFGHPNITPIFDEFAMFMAFAASLRSAELARQVGAVIARDNEILATGANDCPRKGGGLYWSRYDAENKQYVVDPPDVKGTDFSREFDSNAREKGKLIDKIASELAEKGLDKKIAIDVLDRSQLKDITEYGRSVHAEMEALLHCTRNNISAKGATLYCTTFPCHNCAKHIVAAGINRVVYVEPYPKSKAFKLHDDAISGNPTESSSKVVFEPFAGVGPRRFFDLFSMRLGLGRHLERKDDYGDIVKWTEKDAEPRITLSPIGCVELAKTATNDFKIFRMAIEKKLGKELVKATKKDIDNYLKEKQGEEEGRQIKS